MNVHGTAWLTAYVDGELQGARLQQVEAHLSRCQECQAEIAQLRKLRTLLQSVPVVGHERSHQNFQAQVMRRLPPAPRDPGRERVLKTAWQLAPLAAVAAWAFTQAALLVAGLALLLPGLPGHIAPAGPWLGAIGGSGWAGPLGAWLGLGWGWSALALGLLNLALTTLLAAFLSGWIASWWIIHRQRGNHQTPLAD